MNVVQAVMQILGSIWNGIFGLTSPFFGLTFKQIFVGLFVVIISIRILWDLLGLGAAVIDNVTYIGQRAVRHSRSSRSSRFNISDTYNPQQFNRSNSNPGQGHKVKRRDVGYRGSKPLGGRKRNI